jgi:phosphoglycerate dehydrogenase-like enzyme
MAGLGGNWFYKELVESDVTVTNVSGIYNEQLAGHIMGFLLAFARRLDHYIPLQVRTPGWSRGPLPLELSEKTALIVGVGGAGSEAARLCSAFGMRVIGVDPRETRLLPGLSEIVTPDHLDEKLPEADFVLLTIPESPATMNLFDAGKFARMKQSSYIINIGRGVTIVTDDLVAALRSGKLAGAGLDVVNPEPLPPNHPLWSMPGVLITPHIAIAGSRELWEQRRLDLLIENCKRFDRGEPLRNVVDKQNWF